MPEHRYLMGHFVRRFLIEEMEADRNLSPNTQKSYRDTIRLLFRYVGEHHGAEPVRVTVEQIDAAVVRGFPRPPRTRTRQRDLHAQSASHGTALAVPLHRAAGSGARRPRGDHPGHPAAAHHRAGHGVPRETRGSMPCSRSQTRLARRAGAITHSCCFCTTPGRGPPKRLGSVWRIWLPISAPCASTARDARSGLVRSGCVLPRCFARCSDHESTALGRHRSSSMSTAVRSLAMAFTDSSCASRTRPPRPCRLCATSGSARIPCAMPRPCTFFAPASISTRSVRGWDTCPSATTNRYAEVDLEMKAKALQTCAGNGLGRGQDCSANWHADGRVDDLSCVPVGPSTMWRS